MKNVLWREGKNKFERNGPEIYIRKFIPEIAEKSNIWKQRDRERYKKKKELGKVKLINNIFIKRVFLCHNLQPC